MPRVWKTTEQNRTGTKHQRPESPTVTPPGMRLDNAGYKNSTNMYNNNDNNNDINNNINDDDDDDDHDNDDDDYDDTTTTNNTKQ